MPDPIAKQDYNVGIGRRIRLRRKEMGLSQTALGVLVGLSCQQIQKYEKGDTRIAASRLHQLSLALATTVPALIGLRSEGERGACEDRDRLLDAWERLPESQREPLLRHIEAMAADRPEGYGGDGGDAPAGPA